MRNDIQDWLTGYAEQRSDEWKLQRLGNFTGSEIHRLMKRGRGKDAEWSQDALTYIKKVAGGRLKNDEVLADPQELQDFMWLNNASSKATEWGKDEEPHAIATYASIMHLEVTPCGSIEHPDIPTFRDSPDGLVLEADGVIEAKCPMFDTHTNYLIEVVDAESLKAVKPEYYWQCMAHLEVTGASWCDWMSYCKYQTPAMCLVHIERNEEDIAFMLERIAKAEEMCNQWVEMVRSRKVKRHPAAICVIVNKFCV